MNEPHGSHDWGVESDNIPSNSETSAVDVFSKLPYEILVVMWAYCRPQELLQLCRTNKTLRGYLTQRKAEYIWKAARQSQAVTLTQPMYIQGDTQPDAPWPRVYNLPDPPFHLNEISWADYLFEHACPYCPYRHAMRHPGTYHRACDGCNEQGSRDIHQIKRDYEGKNVDIRLYSILPHSANYGRSKRKFWKPMCDVFRRQMFEFQAEAKHDDIAIKAYVDTGRRLVKELTQQSQSDADNASLDRMFSVWEQACEKVHDIHLKDRLKRNIAMFLYSMRDTHHEPADLGDFCYHGLTQTGGNRKSVYPSWLATDAIIFDYTAAKQQVADRSEELDKIRAFRLELESYVSQEPIRTWILELLNDKLGNTNAEIDGWTTIDSASIRRICANHLPDILEQPKVKMIVNEMQGGKDHEYIRQLWEEEWSYIRREIEQLQSTWDGRLRKQVETAGHAGTPEYLYEIQLQEHAFCCSNCGKKYLFYPEVLSHSCFNMVVDSPRLSDELANPVWKGGNGRPKPLDLDSLVYSEGTTFKLRVVMAAIREGGADLPQKLSELPHLAGSFGCRDCARQGAGDTYYSRMSWQTAASHALETTQQQEYQEDGEWLEMPRLHLNLQYNRDIPAAGPNDDWE